MKRKDWLRGTPRVEEEYCGHNTPMTPLVEGGSGGLCHAVQEDALLCHVTTVPFTAGVGFNAVTGEVVLEPIAIAVVWLHSKEGVSP